jgi:glycerol-3-phosphate dehydrogenase (NAD(P)+)
MKVAVLGAGAWGTALAKVLHENGHTLVLWTHDPEHLSEIAQRSANERYLPGVKLPAGWTFERDAARAVRDAEAVLLAVPSKAFRDVSRILKVFRGPVISVTKGIEYETGLTMCGILHETAPQARSAALSGPSLALEVAQGVPTAIVAASSDLATAQVTQELFHGQNFRVYTSTDEIGVELGGALKNVVAIAAGVGDGMGFGDNSKAALITRAIAEIRRLGVACGAQAETFSGLSGLGDLVVTCFSRLSRNRGFGERLGRGEKLAEVLAHATSVVEGYPTARAAWHLARQRHVATPLIDEIHAVLYEGKAAGRAMLDLMRREPKAED